jgi:hypothetical protein
MMKTTKAITKTPSITKNKIFTSIFQGFNCLIKISIGYYNPLTYIWLLRFAIQNCNSIYVNFPIIHLYWKAVIFLIPFLIAFCQDSFGTDVRINNIQSFAKPYGFVRWFYPGEEASKTDWDKFAVYGIRKVDNTQDENQLRQILLELFKPISPCIFNTIYTSLL